MSSGSFGKKDYEKKWLPISEQVTKLETRGLHVSNRASAEEFLGHVNYYRFTGYCLAFETSRHRFLPGITFDQVKGAYLFDAKLRDLFNEALELIEIDLCTLVAYFFGEQYGAFGHTREVNFHERFDFNTSHREWIEKLNHETRRSTETFVKHFRQKYNEFPNLPVWVTTELMSFGSLSRMIGGMHKRDRQRVAAEFNVRAKVLSSVTHHFVYVRNLCAHHARLWDRTWSIKPELPNDSCWLPPSVVSNERLFTTLLLMRKFLLRSRQVRSEADKWRDRVNDLLSNPPSVSDPLATMGLPKDWIKHPVWA